MDILNRIQATHKKDVYVLTMENRKRFYYIDTKDDSIIKYCKRNNIHTNLYFKDYMNT